MGKPGAQALWAVSTGRGGCRSATPRSTTRRTSEKGIGFYHSAIVSLFVGKRTHKPYLDGERREMLTMEQLSKRLSEV